MCVLIIVADELVLLNTSSLALDAFVVASGKRAIIIIIISRIEAYVVYVLQEDGWETVPVKSKNKSSKA